MRFLKYCDEISVLRDGNLVMTKSTKDANMNELIAAMVGRSLITGSRLLTIPQVM